jgi:hypothetical protein
MKTCGYCGKENADEAKGCFECGTSFSGESDVQTWSIGTMMEDVAQFPSLACGCLRRQMPFSVRLVLWLVAWGAVIWSTFQHHPEDLRSCLGFPLGFCGLLPEQASITVVMLVGWAVFIVGWVLYGLISAAILISKRLGWLSIFYIVFCVLLALNLTGCRHLIETASGLH